MKAIITLEKPNKPGLILLARHLGNARRSSQINISGISSTEKEVIVEGDFSSEELDSILHTSRVAHKTNYVPERPAEETGKPKIVYPDDYGALKGRVKTQQEEIEEKRGRVSILESDLEELRKTTSSTIRSLETTVRDLRAECDQVPTVQDAVSRMMIRENNLWESFAQFHDSTIKTYAGLGGVNAELLEKDAINYIPLQQRPDYKEKEREYQKVKELKRLSEETPNLVKLTEEALNLVAEVETLEKQDEAARGAGEELRVQASCRKMPLIVRAEGEETFLTLPFRYREKAEDYHKLEAPLRQEVANFLKSIGVPYIEENITGLVRYRISGIGTRARNRLIKAIAEGKDAFTSLGGEREVIEIQKFTHHN